MNQLIENFVEMMSVERAASANTLISYKHDLNNLSRYLTRKKLCFEKIENPDMSPILPQTTPKIDFSPALAIPGIIHAS